MSIFEKNQALAELFEQHKARLCEEEGLTEEEIRSAIEAGTMVLLGNPRHQNVKPILVGQPARVKINANIGTSPFHCSVKGEMRKLNIALKAGADTVMDLSIAGDLDAIRQGMLKACPLPLGTVPMYAVGQRLLDGSGAIRVHGGGFAGTIQAFVPKEKLDAFRTGMEALLGAGRCHVLYIRPQGGSVIFA